MDFTLVKLAAEGSLDVSSLTSLRNSSVHEAAFRSDDPQLIICDDIHGTVYLGFRIPDVLQASLAKGGILYSQPHEVMIYAYLDIAAGLLFVGSVNQHYVLAIRSVIEQSLRLQTHLLEIPEKALLALVENHAVAFYGAEFQRVDGDRGVMQHRADLSSVVTDKENRLLSVTITPKVASQDLFMLTVKAKGTFHVNCGSLGELLQVFRLVVDLTHA